MGTSSSLFNAILLNLPTANESVAQQLVESILQVFNNSEKDIAVYPNPFRGVNSSSSAVAQYTNLTLVDGVFLYHGVSDIQGEDLQNVPLWPLLQKERNVDSIFAVDSSADTQNWPNATAIVATYEKFMLNATSDVVFPYVPDQQTYFLHSTTLIIIVLSISVLILVRPFLDAMRVTSLLSVEPRHS